MRRVAALLAALIGAAASAEPVAVGGVLAPFEIEDQHGETHRVDESIALILFSRRHNVVICNHL